MPSINRYVLGAFEIYLLEEQQSCHLEVKPPEELIDLYSRPNKFPCARVMIIYPIIPALSYWVPRLCSHQRQLSGQSKVYGLNMALWA